MARSRPRAVRAGWPNRHYARRGAVGFPRRPFAGWDAIAALTWSIYSTLLGYLGGTAFHDEPLKGVLVGLGLALAVTLAIEIARRYRARSTPAAAARDHVGAGRPGSAA